jgi:hypothetical protein
MSLPAQQDANSEAAHQEVWLGQQKHNWRDVPSVKRISDGGLSREAEQLLDALFEIDEVRGCRLAWAGVGVAWHGQAVLLCWAVLPSVKAGHARGAGLPASCQEAMHHATRCVLSPSQETWTCRTWACAKGPCDT